MGGMGGACIVNQWEGVGCVTVGCIVEFRRGLVWVALCNAFAGTMSWVVHFRLAYLLRFRC